MLYPRLLTNDLFDDIFDDFMRPAKPARNSFGGIMKTDVRETADAYFLDIELPGVKKENLSVELKDGALEIKAVTFVADEDKDDKVKYLRRERFFGSCSRSFYVGEDIKQEDIKAKFENGVLTLTVPKVQPQQKVEQHQFISIE